MQLADEHLSVDSEKCRDTLRNPCVADNDTTALVERWLDDERPDLVVLSGMFIALPLQIALSLA